MDEAKAIFSRTGPWSLCLIKARGSKITLLGINLDAAKLQCWPGSAANILLYRGKVALIRGLPPAGRSLADDKVDDDVVK